MPTFDELDALIAEARDPGKRCAWCEARATGWAFSDMSAGYGRDPQASCGPSHGFQWEPDGRLASPDLIERLVSALSALRDTNPEEWEQLPTVPGWYLPAAPAPEGFWNPYHFDGMDWFEAREDGRFEIGTDEVMLPLISAFRRPVPSSPEGSK